MKALILHTVLRISLILLVTSCTKYPKDVVDDYYRKGAFNGSVIVVKEGKIVCDTALGFSSMEKNLKSDKNTSFYIASLSKSFTATAIMMLQQKGLLDYDDKASRYVELPDYAKNITIRQLLHHTSGIRDYEDLFEKKGLTNQDVIQWLFSLRNLEFPSDSQFKYSNSGYIILSQLIEKVSGVSYRTFIHREIIQPLKMGHTYVYEASTAIPNRALGYDRKKKPDDYSILTTGDGGIYSTPEDLYTFDQALRNFTLVNKDNTARMYAPSKLTNGSVSNYGFAWFVEDKHGKKTAVHTGGLSGFRALFWRDLQHNSCIIALTNQGDAFPHDHFLNDMKKTIQ
ncbi:serine hydrolase domain-containing protein [Chryseobacterium pennipullorum]|uniref:Serine hydrolase n=1 Tax=Chryseobacterium pennipullorum TaxID=2258963 RepID=A0A3D9BA99_9FLAO|nr:serine hydrolase domain-containing protein [Chryseobacterium pennipullorum]REC50146.1 serine hydrolase [Chryseobacterium pennipullorum]